jgi:hypothetical protein
MTVSMRVAASGTSRDRSGRPLKALRARAKIICQNTGKSCITSSGQICGRKTFMKRERGREGERERERGTEREGGREGGR